MTDEPTQHSRHNRTGILATDVEGELVVRRVLVRVVSGDSSGTEAVLEGGTVVIGSHPDVDLVLSDTTVSRYHAELALLVEGVRVRDLKSTNGTFVGSSRIESVVLTPAAEIKVGRTRIELLPADLPAPTAPSEATRFGRVVGASPAMRRLFSILERVAASDVPVLIEGEAGVGKSEVARAVHEASSRHERPFAAVDLSGSINPGDVTRMVEAASGGTLVLDRIDQVTTQVASELVQLLERRESGQLDVRVLATSRTDLRARVEAGAAPRDLYFHVAAVRLHVPPLRERLDDLPRLVREISQDLGQSQTLSSADLATLRAQDFPGNVRELSRSLEEMFARMGPASPRERLRNSEPAQDLSGVPFKEAKEQLVDGFERDYVKKLLERHQGNLSRAAQEAGLDRNYLSRLAKKHGLR